MARADIGAVEAAVDEDVVAGTAEEKAEGAAGAGAPGAGPDSAAGEDPAAEGAAGAGAEREDDAVAEARALKLWIILARAFRAVEARAQGDAARHDLTLAQFGILDALYHRGPMLVGELQERILVSSGGISYLVDSLEARDLVERQPSPRDRRARYVTLTVAGRVLFKRVFPEHARAIRQAMAGLEADEQREATVLLRRLGLAAAALAGDPGAGGTGSRTGGASKGGAEAATGAELATGADEGDGRV